MPTWPEKAKIGFKDPIHKMIYPKKLTLDCQESLQIGITSVLQKSRRMSNNPSLSSLSAAEGPLRSAANTPGA
ncbi:MAG: hypothetical protein ACLQPD_10905 [Desulfomonilaceae bacterium]